MANMVNMENERSLVVSSTFWDVAMLQPPSFRLKNGMFCWKYLFSRKKTTWAKTEDEEMLMMLLKTI